jgi:hypothetical protein
MDNSVRPVFAGRHVALDLLQRFEVVADLIRLDMQHVTEEFSHA